MDSSLQWQFYNPSLSIDAFGFQSTQKVYNSLRQSVYIQSDIIYKLNFTLINAHLIQCIGLIQYFKFFQIILLDQTRPPMSKKNQQNKKSVLITQEDKTSNPIFNSIYKKIRNLNKKLANIELLQKQPAQTLKEQQVLKIQRKIDTVNQIKKNQEFALFYKNILEENGGVAFDTSDLLIKVSTLLAVGQYAKKTNNIPKELKNFYENTYQKATQYKDMNVSLSDRIVDIFNILNDFIKSEKSYQACKNYISFLPEQKPNSQILQVQSKIQQAPIAQTKQAAQKQTVKPIPIAEPVVQKLAKKVQQEVPKVVSEPVKVEAVKVEKAETKPQNVKKSWLGYSDDEHQNQDPVEKKQKQESKQKATKATPNQTKQQKEPKTLQESSTNQGQKQVQNKNTQYKPRNSNNYRRGNNQRGGYKNYNHQDSRPYKNHNKYEEQQHHKPRGNYQQGSKYGDKKYNQPKKTQNNRDSGSDTSLEPTPEKLQKKQFVKYVQKR